MNKKLDIVVIFKQDDEHYLADLRKSIPDYAKLILVTTIPSKVDRFTILANNDSESNCILEYTRDFDFAYARNKALSMATKRYIMSLDADERILTHQHQQILEYLNLFDSIDNFGGAICYNFSVKTAFQNKFGLYETEVMPQPKIFVNGSYWENTIGNMHESLIMPKYTVLYSTPITIHHVGYEITKEKQIEKIENYHYLALADRRKQIIESQRINLTTQSAIENIKKSLLNKGA